MDHALAGPQRGEVARFKRCRVQQPDGESHMGPGVLAKWGRRQYSASGWQKIKTDEKGEPSVYKSRLVAKGFQQKEKEDYKEVFAPTAKSPTLRVLLAVAAVRKWKVKQMDIVTAFLYGIVERSSSDKEIDGVQRKLTEQFKCKSLGQARQLKEKELRVKTRGNSNPWSGAYSTLLCILGLTSALLWDSWLE
ncbi:hypothetical protein CLOP_g10887 [Closterium sp. NIES-67]|nr:hypothetical protein CLOP_g10887 [Closterium sp. NIES-67]